MMIEVDDIAHQTKTHIKQLLGSRYNPLRERKFELIDNKYHKAIYKDEKIDAAEELEQMILDQGILLQQLGKMDMGFLEKLGRLHAAVDKLESM